MKSSVIKIIAGVALVGGVGAYAYVRLFASPRTALVHEITSLQRGIVQYEDALRQQQGDKARLEAIGATTLGATQAQVESRFRSSLGEIARHCGLEQVVPNSGEARAVTNPAAQSSPPIRGEFGRMLKADPDFYVVQGSLTGVGTLDQVLETLATVQSQAWAHRVGSVTVRPIGAERAQFELRIDAISTIMMPDIVSAEASAPAWSALTERERKTWASVTAKNMFRLPSPPEAEVTEVAAPPAPEPAPKPSYDQWKLTALPGGRTGSLAGLVNLSTGEQKFLEVGDSVLDAQLAEIDRFSAVFELAGQRCEVQIGQTLAERREIP